MRCYAALALAIVALLNGCGERDGGAQGLDPTLAAGSGGRSDVPRGGSSSGGSSAGAGPSAGAAAMKPDAGAKPSGGQPDAGAPSAAGHSGESGLDAGPDARALADASTAACTVEAADPAPCTSYLCEHAGTTFLAVKGNEPWRVGALGWNASLCDRSLGWEAGYSRDNLQLYFGLTLAALRDVRAGVPVFVYYAGPMAQPINARACSLELTEGLPACPESAVPPVHLSMRGCRGPLDPGCEVCKTFPAGDYHSSSGGDWYNVESVSPPSSCTDACPTCASCSYRDEEQSRALPERPECEPCPGTTISDACFDPSGCACWCKKKTWLRDACPTLLL